MTPRAVGRTVGLNVLLPTLVFFLLRGPLHDDAEALAIGGAVPVARTVLALLRHRPVEPLAVLSGAGFAVSLVVYLLTGRNPVALELHEPVLTGTLGLGILVAVLLGVQVDTAVVRLAPPLARERLRAQAGERRTRDPATHRRATGIVVIVAVTLLVHALALLVTALSQPIARYVVISRLVGLPILVLGVGVASLYGYRTRSR